MSNLDDRDLVEIVNRFEGVGMADPRFEDAVVILRLVDALNAQRRRARAAEAARDLNLRGLAEIAAQLTAQRERAEDFKGRYEIAHDARMVAEAENDRLRAAVAAVRALADRDDLTYVRLDDSIGVALRSRQAVADMIHATLDKHLGES